MQEKIEKIESDVAALNKIIDEEQAILAKLFKATNGYLSGRWSLGDEPLVRNSEIKVKVDCYHLIGSNETVYCGDKALKIHLFMSLFKTTSHSGKEYYIDPIASGWKSVRNYVSLSSVVDVFQSEIENKLHDANKQNLQDLHEKVDQVS